MIEFGRDFDQSTAAPFIFDIHETADQALHIVLALAAEIKDDMGACTRVVPDQSCTYEIIFDAYVLYQIHRRSFFQPGDEIKTGRYFQIFWHSRLLDELPYITNSGELQPTGEKWTHYGIFAQNHVIDIISGRPPIVLKKNTIHKGKPGGARA